MKKQIDPGLDANNRTVIYFFLRFGLTVIYTVLFGRFPRPKKCHFWPKTAKATCVFYFFPSCTCLAVFGHFPRQNKKFQGSKFLYNCQKTQFFSHKPIFQFGPSSSHHKRHLIYLTEFPYIVCPPSRNYELVIFWRFLNFRPFFGPFLIIVVKTQNIKKLSFQRKTSVDI